MDLQLPRLTAQSHDEWIAVYHCPLVVGQQQTVLTPTEHRRFKGKWNMQTFLSVS